MKKSELKNPIIAALDVDDVNQARRLVDQLQPYVGGFKVGPRLTLRADAKFLKDLSQAGIFFFDHKFFDIPSTTVASVRVAAELGADWVTVHALSGPECLKALAEEELKIKQDHPDFRVLVVTVLTSFTQKTLPPIWKPQEVSEGVVALATSAHAAGLTGIVCSPEEITLLKNKNHDAFLVVPGIRPTPAPSSEKASALANESAGQSTNLAGTNSGGASRRLSTSGTQNADQKDDQQRVATPHQALTVGASALVIGRPIIAHPEPARAAQAILQSLKLGRSL